MADTILRGRPDGPGPCPLWHVRGDSFAKAWTFFAMDLHDGTWAMQVRGTGKVLVATMTVTAAFDDQDTIVTATADKDLMVVDAGEYLYDLQFTSSTGERKTWIAGPFTVVDDQAENA